MPVVRFSHCFTQGQLEHVIDNYLGLRPYYALLITILKKQIHKLEQHPNNPHDNDKPHPIRISAHDAICSGNTLSTFCGNIADPLNDLPLRDPQSNLTNAAFLPHFYIYPLQTVVSSLESAQFYNGVPKHVIVNNLLTATNIEVITETLRIVSEEMSKKIKVTLAGMQIETEIALTNSEDEQSNREIETPSSKHHHLKNSQSQTPPNFPPQSRQPPCHYCHDYLYYLSETTNNTLTDQSLNSLSPETLRCLALISQTLTHFTLYLTHTQRTRIPNDILLINRVLNHIGVVITEDIYNSQLNPKNIPPPRPPPTKPKNLIEQLQPYFHPTNHNQIEQENSFSIAQLLQMVIYSPTTKQIAQQLRDHQTQLCLLSPAGKAKKTDQQWESLQEEQYRIKLTFEDERLRIAVNTVNNKPIYQQLPFEGQKKQNQRANSLG